MQAIENPLSTTDHLNCFHRRVDRDKHEMLQQEVQSLVSLVDDTADELVGVVTQWRSMVDLLSARLMAWQVSTNTRLAALLTRAREVELDIDGFASDLNADADTMQAMYDALADERATFAAYQKAAKEEFAATQALATSLNHSAAGRVKLNVGGCRFEVAVDTLCKERGSFFARLLEGHFKLVADADGCIFLDRDGAPYAYIFNWLRDSKAVLPVDDVTMMQRLAVEVWRSVVVWGHSCVVVLSQADFLGLDTLRAHVASTLRARQAPQVVEVKQGGRQRGKGGGNSPQSRWTRALRG